LTSDDLTEALESAGTRRCFVADTEGSGTTLLIAPPGADLAPAFGENSAHRHAESGAIALAGPLLTLRLDVDTALDLDHARSRGVGDNTARILAEDQE